MSSGLSAMSDQPLRSSQSCRDLIAWQKGVVLIKSIYRLTSRFPNEEKVRLILQIRRAVLSLAFGSGVNTVFHCRRNSPLSCCRTACRKSSESTPIRPLKTLVLSALSLSARSTDGYFSFVSFKSGGDGSTSAPNYGNRAGAPVVMNATMKSPGDSAVASTTHGRRLAPDRSVKGKTAGTRSPGSGIAGEIRIVMTRFNVRVSVEVGLLLQEVQRAASFGQPGEICRAQVGISWAFQDEHSAVSVGGQDDPRKSEPSICFDIDGECSHVSEIARMDRLPSFISEHTLSTLNSNRPELSCTTSDLPSASC